MRIVLFLITFIVLSSIDLKSQSVDNLRFKKLTVNEGLSHSNVTSIVQDNDGFIWIATSKGLNRFDGYHNKVFKHDFEDLFSLPEDRISKLYFDKKGVLWIGTATKGLCTFNKKTEKFQNIILPFTKVVTSDIDVQPRITDITEDLTGTLWISTLGDGFFKVTNKSTNLKFEHYSVKNGLSNNNVISCIADAKNNIWVSTNDGKIQKFNSKSKQFQTLDFLTPSNGNNSSNIYIDKKQRIWICANSNMYIIKEPFVLKPEINKVIINGKYASNKFFNVRSIIEDHSGRIWIGSFSSAVMVLSESKTDPGSFKMNIIQSGDSHTDGLNYNAVNTIFEDKFKVIWIGTSGGGANYADLLQKPFSNLSEIILGNKNFPDKYVSAIFEDQGEVWIGTRNGLAIYNTANKSLQVYRSNESGNSVIGNHISCIFKDSKERIWVGSRFEGLNLAVKKGNKYLFKHFKHQKDNANSLGSNDVISINEDDYGRLWIATFTNGINIMDPEHEKFDTMLAYNGNKSLSSNNLTNIYKDPVANKMWVATRDAGLQEIVIVNKKSYIFKNYPHLINDNKSISANYVWPILKDHKGTLWVGTIGGGLNKLIYENGKVIFKHYTSNNGIPDNDIESMLEDRNGNLWLGGLGLTRFNPVTEESKHFDVNDGLQSNSFKIGSSYKNTDGILYFGGINGLNYFDPSSIKDNPLKPKTLITGLRIHSKLVKTGDTLNNRVILTNSIFYQKNIELNYKENDFTFEFIGLHYGSPANIYAYKLEGYHKDWITINADEKSASFANLPAGNYKFLVKSANKDNLWDTNPASISIRILPPWWKTWWAYSIYIIILGALIAYYQYFTTHQASLKHELEMANKDHELDQSKLTFFTNISHELRTPLTLIIGPLQELIDEGKNAANYDEKISLIHKNSNRLLSLTNQLLTFRKNDTGALKLNASLKDIVAFTEEIFILFKAKADQNKFDYHFKSSKKAISLYFDKEKLDLILINLLSNAFKYTAPEGAINVNLYHIGSEKADAIYEATKLTDNYLLIKVADNGSGIPSDEINKIFDIFFQASNASTSSNFGSGLGLALVKTLVQLHKGNIEVDSQKDKGTVFSVKLPFGRKHLNDVDIVPDFEIVNSFEQELPDILASTQPTETLPASSNKYTILIVEDNLEVRRYLKSHLIQDYKIIEAENGLIGLEKAKKHIPDLIISDLMMPKMNGLDLCNTINKDTDLNFIPFILLTASASEVHELEGLENGATDYITKPFHVKILKTKVKNIFRYKETLKEFYNHKVQLKDSSIIINTFDETFLQKAISFIEDNLENPDFNVQALFNHMNMSHPSLYKRIKDLSGLSIIEFIRDIRIKKAAELLKKPDINVSEAAYLVGINDMKYFRTCFQKQFNQTPNAYKKSMENQASAIKS